MLGKPNFEKDPSKVYPLLDVLYRRFVDVASSIFVEGGFLVESVNIYRCEEWGCAEGVPVEYWRYRMRCVDKEALADVLAELLRTAAKRYDELWPALEEDRLAYELYRRGRACKVTLVKEDYEEHEGGCTCRRTERLHCDMTALAVLVWEHCLRDEELNSTCEYRFQLVWPGEYRVEAVRK